MTSSTNRRRSAAASEDRRAEPARSSRSRGRQAPGSRSRDRARGTGAAKPEAAAVAGKGTLHINAVPAANVAIDGRPLGMTPKIVRLSAGTHRVALIGPGGRRSQTVNVAAGRTATVSVSFRSFSVGGVRAASLGHAGFPYFGFDADRSA